MHNFYSSPTRLQLNLQTAFKFILITICLFACQPFSPIITPQPNPTQVNQVDCESETEPTQADIDASLNFGDEIFTEADGWERSYTVETQRVSVSWTNDEESAVAYIDYLIFSCGYTNSELVNYFDDGYWDILFQNYESYEPLNACGGIERGLALHEFSAVADGSDYSVRYWVRPERDGRVLTMFLVFPHDDSSALIEFYARQMFPSFTSCGG